MAVHNLLLLLQQYRQIFFLLRELGWWVQLVYAIRYEFYAVGFPALGNKRTFLQTPGPTVCRGPEHIFRFSILVTMTPSKPERLKQKWYGFWYMLTHYPCSLNCFMPCLLFLVNVVLRVDGTQTCTSLREQPPALQRVSGSTEHLLGYTVITWIQFIVPTSSQAGPPSSSSHII